jgi:hypothetical protein
VTVVSKAVPAVWGLPALVVRVKWVAVAALTVTEVWPLIAASVPVMVWAPVVLRVAPAVKVWLPLSAPVKV